MLKQVFAVTHGEKDPGLDPGMTLEGFAQVRALRQLLPPNIIEVVCGTGRRHLDVASALGLTPTRFTAAIGGPESLEKVTVYEKILSQNAPDTTAPAAMSRWNQKLKALQQIKSEGEQSVVLLASGMPVSRAKYTTPEDGFASALEVLRSVDSDAVLTVGRPFMIMFQSFDPKLTDTGAKSATVYRFDLEDGELIAITEVKSIGTAEAQTV